MFTKIIFTILVVTVVWFAFRTFTRMADQREKRAKMDANRANPASDGVEDMVKCSLCGSYVTRGAQSCGKEGCPFRG
jgi:cbb3-type cytochrome oxidase subunit 3